MDPAKDGAHDGLKDDKKLEDKKLDDARDVERDSDTTSVRKGDLLSLEAVDPVLNAKMSLVNDVSTR